MIFIEDNKHIKIEYTQVYHSLIQSLVRNIFSQRKVSMFVCMISESLFSHYLKYLIIVKNLLHQYSKYIILQKFAMNLNKTHSIISSNNQ